MYRFGTFLRNACATSFHIYSGDARLGKSYFGCAGGFLLNLQGRVGEKSKAAAKGGGGEKEKRKQSAVPKCAAPICTYFFP